MHKVLLSKSQFFGWFNKKVILWNIWLSCPFFQQKQSYGVKLMLK